MKKVLFIVITAMLYAASCFAEQKLTASTLVMINKINSNKISSLKHLQTDEQQLIHAYIILKNGASPKILEKHGAEVNMVLDSIVSVRIPVDSIENIAALEEVKIIDSGGNAMPKMDIARGCVRDDMVRGSEGLPSPYLGKDVVIGVIDYGMQLNHINFFDAAKNLRIKRVWLQTKKGTPPDGFTYGKELKTPENIIAEAYDITSDTHATSVAGIAAGGNKGKDFYGIAEESEIVYVGYDYNDNSIGYVPISDGIKYIYDYAGSIGKPCVVNISLGYIYGSHDGCSIFDQVCDALQGAGKLLVGSAGNEGTHTQHISKTFTSDQDTLRTFFSLITNYGSGYASQSNFYGEKGKKFAAKLCVISYGTGKVIAESDIFNADIPGIQTVKFTKSGITGITANINVITEIDPGSQRPHLCVVASLQSVMAGYALGIKLFGDAGTIHGWADDQYSRFKDYTTLAGWSAGDTDCTIAEIGGTGKKIITVGAYKSRDFTNAPKGIGNISSFSSKGPTADGRMKPDITAPGEWVISSFSDAPSVINDVFNRARIKEGDSITVNGKKYFFAPLRGTSMAAPIVAGTLALWLQAKPDLTPDDIRAILRETSIKDNFTGQTPGNTWGYGKLDAWTGLKKVLLLTSVNEMFVTESNDIIIFGKDGRCNILFAKEAKNIVASIYDISGRLLVQQRLGNASAGEEFSLDRISYVNGTYIVTVTGESFSKRSKICF
ncbi:MAG: S8 family peptidase [Bacteroidales bacterium]